MTPGERVDTSCALTVDEKESQQQKRPRDGNSAEVPQTSAPPAKKRVGVNGAHAISCPPEKIRMLQGEKRSLIQAPIFMQPPQHLAGFKLMTARTGEAIATLRNGTSLDSQLPPFPTVGHDTSKSIRELIEVSRLTRPPPPIPFIYPNIIAVPAIPILDLRQFQSNSIGLHMAQLHGSMLPFSPFDGNNLYQVALPSLPLGNMVAGRLGTGSRETHRPNSRQAPRANSKLINGDAHLASLSQQEERAKFNFFPSPSTTTTTTTPNRNDGEALNAATTDKPNVSIPAPVSKKRCPHKKRERVSAKPHVLLTLYISSDDEKLNENQIYLRKQTEVFRATEEDVLSITRGKNKPLFLHQVGIRCRFCSQIPVGGRAKGATYFPSNLSGMYQAAQNLSFEHFQSGRCTELPPDVRERFLSFVAGKPAASGAGKKYWADSASKLGLVDTEDGIRFATDVRGKR